MQTTTKPTFGPGARVRLTVDLTQYHASLTRGVIGTQTDWHASIGDRFTTVRFPVVTLPILYQSLEPIEQDAGAAPRLPCDTIAPVP